MKTAVFNSFWVVFRCKMGDFGPNHYFCKKGMRMEKIHLTRREKEVLRLICSGCCCPSAYPLHLFVSSVRTLETKGLVKGAWIEGGRLEDARLTAYGREYLALNPLLRNPIDWKWIVTTAIALAAFFAIIFCVK